MAADRFPAFAEDAEAWEQGGGHSYCANNKFSIKVGQAWLGVISKEGKLLRGRNTQASACEIQWVDRAGSLPPKLCPRNRPLTWCRRDAGWPPADFIKSGGFDKEEIAQMRDDIQFWVSVCSGTVWGGGGRGCVCNVCMHGARCGCVRFSRSLVRCSYAFG